MAASQFGLILMVLPATFDQYQTDIGLPLSDHGQLRIKQVRSGSMIVDFILVGAAAFVAVDEARERLVEFVHRLIRAVRILAGDESGAARIAESNAIRALKEPIDDGDVITINLHVHGDNAQVLLIDRGIALRINNRGGRHDQIGERSFAAPRPRFETARQVGHDIVIDLDPMRTRQGYLVVALDILNEKVGPMAQPLGFSSEHRQAIRRAYLAAWDRLDLTLSEALPDQEIRLIERDFR